MFTKIIHSGIPHHHQLLQQHGPLQDDGRVHGRPDDVQAHRDETIRGVRGHPHQQRGTQ